MRTPTGFVVIALLLAGGGARAHAGSPVRYCRSVGTDDTLRTIPRSLVPAATKLFGLQSMPQEAVQRSTTFRCFDHQVLLCNVGANLPCGKANTKRNLPGTEKWCAAHPDSDFIPMYITGHDTIYRWRCRSGQAVAETTLFKVDPRGFIAHFWKPLPPSFAAPRDEGAEGGTASP